MQTMPVCNICYCHAATNREFLFNIKSHVVWFFCLNYECNIPNMMIGSDSINWVAGNFFATCVESNKRTFCGALNKIISFYYLHEECLMEIIQKQCVPILLNGAGVWILNVHMYNHMFFGFEMLPLNMCIDQT